jgi:hypothetical protein
VSSPQRLLVAREIFRTDEQPATGVLARVS